MKRTFVAVPGLVVKILELLGIAEDGLLAFLNGKLADIQAPQEWESELRQWLDQHVNAVLTPEAAVALVAGIVAELKGGHPGFNKDSIGLG